MLVAALVWGISACAAAALAASQDIQQLLKAAGSGDQSARLHAIDTLGDRSEPAPEVIRTLTEQLKDPSAAIRAHALHALGQLGPAARPAVGAMAPFLVDPDVTVRRAVGPGLDPHSPRVPSVTVPLLTIVLHDADPAVRTGAVEVLVETGKPAVPSLAVVSEGAVATYWACLALSEIGPDAAEAVPALANVLKTDTRPEVRREAALGLGIDRAGGRRGRAGLDRGPRRQREHGRRRRGLCLGPDRAGRQIGRGGAGQCRKQF